MTKSTVISIKSYLSRDILEVLKVLLCYELFIREGHLDTSSCQQKVFIRQAVTTLGIRDPSVTMFSVRF